LGLAIRRPEAIRSMVLINPLTDATYTAGWLGWTLWLRRHAPALSHALYAGLGRLTLPQFVATQALAFQFGSIGRAKNLHHATDLRACFTREGQMGSLLMVLDDVMNYSFLDSLEPGTHLPPICTVWGVENRVLSAKAGRRLNENLKPMHQEWLAGCGHLAMMERPDKVVSIAQEFFSEKCLDRT
jgi:pimeloyl-ACP methyl ester carboxylesterase